MLITAQNSDINTNFMTGLINSNETSAVMPNHSLQNTLFITNPC